MKQVRKKLSKLYGNFRQRYCGILFSHETMLRLTVGSRMQGYCIHCGTRIVLPVRLAPGATPVPGVKE